MQNDDGGWARVRQGCDNEVLTYIPFADHNAMIDPSCEDITGRALEALDQLGDRPDHPAVRRAVAYLQAKQEADGTWYGRWGCNYIYGTWLALRGLCTPARTSPQARYQRAGSWLRATQNAGRRMGRAAALLRRSPAEGDRSEHAVADGLGPDGALRASETRAPTACAAASSTSCAHQQYDGSWRDEHWTGTGFPRVFYLRYHLYATYFPLWALSLYRRAVGAPAGGRADRKSRLPRRAVPPVKKQVEYRADAISGPHHDGHDPEPGPQRHPRATSATRSS